MRAMESDASGVVNDPTRRVQAEAREEYHLPPVLFLDALFQPH